MCWDKWQFGIYTGQHWLRVWLSIFPRKTLTASDTFPPDKGEKIFWQERVTGKAPWRQQKSYRSGCTHTEFNSLFISIPISLFARWRLGTEEVIRVFSESENRASTAKGHEPCKQYKLGASCFTSVTCNHCDRARRPQVQPGWTTEFFPRQKSLFLVYLL